jgi:glucose-1-phosphate thymidylyltransferase
MKVIIPAAGEGTRLRPHTHTSPKVLLHVAGKPILGHILDEIAALSPQEVIFVVGHLGEKIEEYVGKHYRFKASYLVQQERKGLGHAVYQARPRIGPEEPVLIVLGDTIFRAPFKEILSAKESLLGVKEVDDPRRFGVVEVKNVYVSRLEEKPAWPASNLVIVGIYYLRKAGLLFEGLEEIIEKGVTVKGEFQLTDALERMVRKGEKMRLFPIDDWFDCGKVETMLSTNRELLKRKAVSYALKDSILIPPVFIANPEGVEHSIIGPYVSIAEGATVRRAILRDAIVSENAIVEDIALHNSLIGENAVVKGSYRALNVGDSSEVDLR